MKNRILEFLDHRKKIYSEISELIGYCDEETPIENYLKNKWNILGDQLLLKHKGEEYSYTISSLASAGKEFYKGSKNDITYVMAYDENDGWDKTILFMLDDKNKDKHLIGEG